MLAVIYLGEQYVGVLSTFNIELVDLIREQLQKKDPRYRVKVEEYFREKR